MMPNEFVQCFNRFFQLGTESFFKNAFDGFSMINNNFSNFRTPNRSSFQENGRNNNTPVTINNRRLQWYDSNLQRALAPMPKGVPKSLHITKEELELLSTKTFDDKKMNEYEITECDICLGTFKNGSQIKVLPCRHSYHGECIDKWLLQHPMCPHCRAGVKSGLRRQLATKKNVNNNKIITNPVEQNESIEKRRKLFNEYYLKKRKKRLEKLSAGNSKCQMSKGNVKQMVELKEESIETVTISENQITVVPTASEHISSPRLKAVEAALKRLEVSKE